MPPSSPLLLPLLPLLPVVSKPDPSLPLPHAANARSSDAPTTTTGPDPEKLRFIGADRSTTVAIFRPDRVSSCAAPRLCVLPGDGKNAPLLAVETGTIPS